MRVLTNGRASPKVNTNTLTKPQAQIAAKRKMAAKQDVQLRMVMTTHADDDDAMSNHIAYFSSCRARYDIRPNQQAESFANIRRIAIPRVAACIPTGRRMLPSGGQMCPSGGLAHHAVYRMHALCGLKNPSGGRTKGGIMSRMARCQPTGGRMYSEGVLMRPTGAVMPTHGRPLASHGWPHGYE